MKPIFYIQTALVTFWRVKVVSVGGGKEEPGIVYEVQEVISILDCIHGTLKRFGGGGGGGGGGGA